MLYTLRIDWIEATTEGDDSCPGDGETVRFDTVPFQELHILSPAIVRVSGKVTIAAICSLSWCPRKVIPDGFATAVGVGRSFDLEGG